MGMFESARRLNRHPRLLAGVRSSRERALGDDEFVARLSSRRGRPADLAARRLVELRGDEHGLLGELGLSAIQAWQRLSERQDRGRGKVDVAILFTDLVGFSSWALEAGDRSAIRLLGEVGEAIEPPILDRHGEVVKRLGDGLMAAFWDPSGAAEAAFEASRRISGIEVDGYRPRLRTGIHLGRPRRIGGDYFGVDVNVAARVAEAAGAGEVLISDAVRQKVEGGETVQLKRRWRFSAKGAPKGLKVYAAEPS
jgi:adenylate cyclase